MGKILNAAGYTLCAGFLVVAGTAGLEPLGSENDDRLGLTEHMDAELMEKIESNPAETVREKIKLHAERAGERMFSAGPAAVFEAAMTAINGEPSVPPQVNTDAPGELSSPNAVDAELHAINVVVTEEFETPERPQALSAPETEELGISIP